MKREAYPTDLTDKQWKIIEPLIPKPKSRRGRKRKHSYREILNAIFYVLRTGCAWRMLPHDFPPWKTVYHYFRLWRINGTWEKINSALRKLLRKAKGRNPEPSAAVLDTQTVKTTDVKGVRGYDAAKKIKGRKRHLLVDTLGLILVALVHPADVQDRDGAKEVLSKAKEIYQRLRLIWADGGYSGQLVEWVKEKLGWVLEIVKRDPEAEGFQVLPRRWVIERTFGWLVKYRRLRADYEVLTETDEAMIYAAMIHLMVRRLSRYSTIAT